MCGIAGFVLPSGPGLPPRETRLDWLSRMTRAMAHRGPDGEGLHLDGPAALGHRRLSIIDLAAGGQPMQDADQRAAITFNGEIYNYRELKPRFEQRGFAFRTQSDTEAILAAWLTMGAAGLDLLEGMFAFALWDRSSQTLFAARDRFGKKPFFYTLQNGVFAFASELTALTQLPFLRFETPLRTLGRFVAYEYVPTPETIYKDVYQLRPGHYLLFRDGAVTEAPYWDMPMPGPAPKADETELCEELRRLLGQAVKRRLVSDVPLGVFLSGGIDSSTVAALMAGQTSHVKTFSIGFSEASYDESRYAKLVADRYATDHHERILSADACGALLPEIVARFDQPMADPSIVPTSLLSQVTREEVTVALGGDGPDELLYGYEYYPAFVLSRLYDKLPRALRRLVVEPLARHLPQSAGYVNPRFVAETFLAGATVPAWLRVQTWLSAFTAEAQAGLWREPPAAIASPETLFAPTRALFEAPDTADPLARVGYVFARQYMLDYILVKVDRCSMMHSLEVRAPFLDRDVAEFVCRLPSRYKLRGSTRKYLLRRAAAPLLPPEILSRGKRGFLIPTAAWLRGQLRPQVDELLGERHLREQGIFDPAAVGALVAAHLSGRADHRKKLWTLLVLQLWLAQHKPTIIA